MSGGYTVWANPAVDRFVGEQLRCVTDGLAELLEEDLEAVVLGGGFGRGEGSVFIAADGSMHVVNDYDVEVIYRERGGTFLSKLLMHMRYRKRMEKLAERLAHQLRLKQIDFGLRGAGSYADVAEPKLADFDLKHGHKLLYGAKDPLALMPEFQPADIPLFEGTWLLRNRGIGLLLARLYLKDEELPETKRENFYIEINKAILAMGDALFILNGKYVCSYAERAVRFHELPQNGLAHMQALPRLYPLAAGYKLKPGDVMYPDMAPVQLWNYVNHLYGAFFLFYESRRLKTPFSTLAQYSEWVSKQSALDWRRRFRLMLDRLTNSTGGCSSKFLALKRDKTRNVLFTMALLASRKSEAIDSAHAGIIQRLGGIKQGVMTEQQWTQLARHFLLLIHPTGEVGRFLLDRRQFPQVPRP